MTDNDIIKALECCSRLDGCCGDECPFLGVDIKDIRMCSVILREKAINLINRQKAEIEEYKKANILIAQQRDGRDKDIADLEATIETLETNNHSLCMTLANSARVERAEAIKEFAVRFKEKATMISKGRLNPTKPMGYELDMEYHISMWDFDNLVKEMVGDAK